MGMIAQQEAAAAAALGIGGLVIVGLVAIVSALVYFLPLAVAIFRGHPQALAIGALDVLLGWTFLGWVVALVWAFTTPAPATTVVVTAPPAARPPGA